MKLFLLGNLCQNGQLQTSKSQQTFISEKSINIMKLNISQPNSDFNQNLKDEKNWPMGRWGFDPQPQRRCYPHNIPFFNYFFSTSLVFFSLFFFLRRFLQQQLIMVLVN